MLRSQIIALAERYGRYGYRRTTALLKIDGWQVNHKRGQRIWREEGLRVPSKQPKLGRLWFADSSCIRKRPEYRNHAWSYDFVQCQTHDGRNLSMLTVIDEFTRECLAIKVARRLNSQTVAHGLFKLFLQKGIPLHIQSENGPEFTSRFIRDRLKKIEVETLFITPGSPWENGYNESCNGTLRDEVLVREEFYTLYEAQVLIERWRNEYNTIRPHSSLGYRPSVPRNVCQKPERLAVGM